MMCKFCYRATHLALLFLIFSSLASASVYYVDSVAGKDTNSGTSTSAPWKTLAKVSSHSYSAGDQILLKSGSTWREQIEVPSSGASGKPIVFGAYGTGTPPLINASDLVGNWSSESGYVYRAAISWSPSHVWFNGTLLTKATSLSSVNSSGKWFYSSSTLYVWAPGNVNPSGHSVEADHRSRAIDINGKSYITIDGLSMKDSTSALVGGYNAAHVTVQNSALKNAYMAIYFTEASPDLVVNNCTMTADSGYVGRDFVFVSSTSADGPVVSNNVVGNINGFVAIMFNDVNNAQAYGNTITGSGGGIETAGTTRSVSGALIYNNAIFDSDQRLVDGESIKVRGNPPYTASAKVYRNFIQGGPYTYDGIGGWYAVDSEVYGNIVMGCVKYGIQFTLDSYSNIFVNNTLYNNPIAGIALYTDGSAEVKNNIVQASTTGISADPGVSVTEDYNILYQVSALRSIQISAGSHTNTDNPKFVSSAPKASSDFKLSSGSPAIGSASNLGSPYNMEMDPNGSVFPYPAVDEDSLGSWERGSFAYR
jgi:parallel beta-helix repeat protein